MPGLSFKQIHVIALLVATAFVFTALVLPQVPVYAQDATQQGQTALDGEDLNARAGGMKFVGNQAFGCFGGDSEKGIVEGCMAFLLYNFMVTMAMLAVWVSGGLNIVIGYLVVGMGKLVGNMPGVTVAWELLRDLANVFLVFLTVFIGLATIVGNSKYGAKNLLFRVILAALFVNFSITIAKVVIDVSNVVAIETYTMLIRDHVTSHGGSTIPDCAERDLFGADVEQDTCITVGVAGAFWSQMEVMKLFNIDEFEGQSTGGADKHIMWVGLAGGLMFLVLAFVFGAAMFILLTRFVTLVLLIIVSPLAFVMWVTGVSNQGAKWWHMLINQSLVAPAMFLMWWIAYKMVDEAGAMFTFDNGLAKGGMNDMGSIAILTFFFITIAMLIASLVVAKELGSRTASTAMNIGQRWSRYAGGALFAGTVGYGASKMGQHYNTIRSRSAANIQKKLERAEEDIASGDPHRRTSGYLRRAGLNALREAGNVANVAALGQLKTGSTLDRAIGSGFGLANKKVGGAPSYADRRKAQQDRAKQLHEIGSQDSLRGAAALANQYHGHDSDTALEAHLSATTSLNAEQRRQRIEQVKAARRTIKGATQRDLEWLHENHRGQFTGSGFAESLGAKQMSAIEESALIDRQDRSNMQNIRSRSLSSALVAGDERKARGIMRNLSDNERKAAGRTLSAQILSPATTPTQRATIVNSLVGDHVLELSDAAIMHTDTAGNMDVIDNLTSVQLKALDRADRLGPTQRNTIYRRITSTPPAPAAGGPVRPHGTPSARTFFTSEQGRMWM